MTEWVVTYKIEFSNRDVMVTEFFRGEREECERIRARSGSGESDMQRTKKPWKPIIGPACDWDAFLED